MARIIHRCLDCNHAQDQHGGDKGCCIGWCGCRSTNMGPSELSPTWVFATMRENPNVHEPGGTFDGGLPPVQLCGCEECRELFAAVAS